MYFYMYLLQPMLPWLHLLEDKRKFSKEYLVKVPLLKAQYVTFKIFSLVMKWNGKYRCMFYSDKVTKDVTVNIESRTLIKVTAIKTLCVL